MQVFRDIPPLHTVPLFKSRRSLLALVILVGALYFGLAIATIETSRPGTDEAAFANPSYNLIHYGFMGTTIYEDLGDAMPAESLKRHTYWNPPLLFLVNAAFFKVFGFGLFQIRITAVLWGGVALCAWYFIIRSGCNSPTLSVLVAGFVSLGYFFQIGAATGRMDMMCLALGTSGLASYCVLRNSNLKAAVFVSNVLVVASGLTHAVGIAYFCGLAVLTLGQDWKRLRGAHLALAVLPYLVGAAGWGAYISEDPAAFREQMAANVAVTRLASGIPAGFSPLVSLKQEAVRRYLTPFGFEPGAPPLSRTKSIVLLMYIAGMAGLLWVKRLRQDPLVRILLILAGIDFLVLTFVATQKNYYYLPHTTAVFSGCLALFLLRAPAPGSRGQSLAVIALAGLVALQAAGLVARDRQNTFKNSFLPTIQTIRAHSAQGDLIFGPAECWPDLLPDREVVHDWKLGYSSGRKGKLIVLDGATLALMEDARIQKAPVSAHIERLLAHAHKIYTDNYYSIYEPAP
jgi:4-amino-4-deoxy-L-arabinose transferase-like glycosyltransferase